MNKLTHPKHPCEHGELTYDDRTPLTTFVQLTPVTGIIPAFRYR